ncbi:outer membrane beta-barrel protein [Mucilaginibacter litoreus]|uniref:Outer membrane beta-barrel protein n=1 Tax=Mucilaginibacter litoreus TaxID=1048221 RepID=A0ABW3ANP4_9SPHI
MKFTITALAFFCLCSLTALAQTPYSVKGVAIDSVANVKLANTSVSVLNAKDSILVNFTRAKTDGSFNIPKLKKGSFILLVTYPGYADYVERFTLDSVKTTHNFGSISMNLKSRLLKEVIVKGTVAAIKIKGDTTEFNAKAFKIEPNSKVEDLLRQLPGIQVDKDGKITAQGQSVPKVLVDGEEFFGDDPTLVTKNIRADMVDKVQLYDKKSDQATFTGIDDGEKTKTINIKLKEDKKSGYFGKVQGGIGTDDYYETQALFNIFKGKKKFSAYGTISNTGKIGLGWQDNNRLGTQDNMTFGDSGEIYFMGSGDDLDSFDGQYRNQGLPIARTGGVHYDSKWNGDKESINANYKLGSLEVNGTRSSLSRNTLSDSLVLSSQSNETDHNYMFRQKADVMYQVKLDSTSNLKLTVDGTLKNSDTHTVENSSTSNNDQLVNTQTRTLDNNLDGKIFNATAFYTKKLKKPGRTFSINLSTGINESKAHGNLFSNIDYYKGGALDDSTRIDQRKTNDLRSTKLLSNITYTEPLSKTWSLVLNYGVNINNSSADRKSFSPSAVGEYNMLIDSLSSDYKFNQLSNQGGAMLNFKQGKHNLNFGTRLANVQFKQIDEETGTEFKRDFSNWAPQLTYQYRFSQQKQFRINYSGSQTQPTLDQIQPVRINNDPLNITLGNPNLDPAFTHRFFANYNSYRVLSDQYISGYGSFSFTTNPIVNNLTTNTETGKNTIQYLNLPGKKPFNYNGGIWMGQKLSWLFDISIGADLGFNGSIYYSMKNSDVNRTNSNTYRGSININKYVQKKYSFNISGGPTYTVGQSSLSPNLNNNSRGFQSNGRISVNLPFKLIISTDGDYTYQAASQSFPEPFSQFIWNANITKSFFKSENLKLVIAGNDLLNKNSGFSRNADGLNYNETRYTTIRRYFLFSIVWDFNKMGGGAPSK